MNPRNTNKIHSLGFLLSVFTLLYGQTAAQSLAPKLLPFQGRLTDQNGVAVSNGVRLVQFKIYSVPAGGAPVWAGELHRTTVNGGLVNVMLGSKTPLSGVDFDKQLYLEITVDVSGPTGQADNSITLADPPMLPRQVILPVVFAKEAAESRHAQNSTLLNSYDWSAFFDNGNPATGKIPGAKLSLSPGSISPETIAAGVLGGQMLTINGPNGQPNILLGDNGANNGLVRVFGPSGIPAGALYASGLGDGNLGLNSADGITKVLLGPLGGNGTLTTYGPAGTQNIRIDGNADGGNLGLYGADGFTKLQLGPAGGNGTLVTYGPGGTKNLRLDAYADNYGRIQVFAPNNKIRAELYTAGNGYGALALFSPNDSFNVYAGPGVNENYGAVYVRNDSSVTKAGVFVDNDGAGAVIRDREYTSSDLRLKKDIRPVTGALDTLNKMRGVSYTRKSGSDFRGREMGVIAQELKEALPEAVVSIDLQKMTPTLPGTIATQLDAQGTLYVDYTAIVAVLIESVKEQQAQIDELRAQLRRLETK